MSGRGPHQVRRAGPGDADAVARLLWQFNREFSEPTPPLHELAVRLRRLLGGEETAALLGGPGPDAVVVLRFRPSLWSDGLECYVAECYVVPEARARGLGRALMENAIDHARHRGADTIDIAVDEPDVVARSLYESLGFSHRTGGRDGPLMFHYERDL